MQSFTKAALCTAAAGAMAFTSAAPAEAQRYRDRDNDGISAGEVIAGALIIGGIAAIASASIRFITPSSMPGGYGGGGAGGAGGGAFGGGSRSAWRHSPSQTPRHGR